MASPLLRLPAEIRNTIYVHVFTGSEVRIGHHWPSDNVPVEIRDPAQSASSTLETTTAQDFLAITLACRQLRSETSLLIFEHVLFVARSEYLERWADRKLQAAQRNAIKTAIFLELPDDRPLNGFASSLEGWFKDRTATFPGLKQVIILDDATYCWEDVKEELVVIGRKLGIEVVHSKERITWW
jgi:hypothetical protein